MQTTLSEDIDPGFERILTTWSTVMRTTFPTEDTETDDHLDGLVDCYADDLVQQRRYTRSQKKPECDYDNY